MILLVVVFFIGLLLLHDNKRIVNNINLKDSSLSENEEFKDFVMNYIKGSDS